MVANKQNSINTFVFWFVFLLKCTISFTVIAHRDLGRENTIMLNKNFIRMDYSKTRGTKSLSCAAETVKL